MINKTLNNYRRSRKKYLIDINQQLILISQIQRSGVTLLSQLFDGHPELYSHPAEITWGYPNKYHFPNLQQYGDITKHDLWKLLYQNWITKFAATAQYKKSPKNEFEQYPFIFDERLQKMIFLEQCEQNGYSSTRILLNSYLTSFFNSWLDYQNLHVRGKKYVTGFTPGVIIQENSPEYFFESYPDGYIIALVRHPAGWYSSAKEHSNLNKGDIPNIMKRWIDCSHAIAKAKTKWSDRLIVIQFERLVNCPEMVMRHICDIVGLNWDPVLTRPTFNSMPIQSNSHYKAVTYVDSSMDENYKQVLDQKTIEYIESISMDAYNLVLPSMNNF